MGMGGGGQVGVTWGSSKWISPNKIVGKHFWCGFWISNLFGPILIFGPQEFLFYFWAPEEGVKVGVLQNESLQTWWCYILSDSNFTCFGYGLVLYLSYNSNAWNWSWAQCNEHVDNCKTIIINKIKQKTDQE